MPLGRRSFGLSKFHKNRKIFLFLNALFGLVWLRLLPDSLINREGEKNDELIVVK